MEINGFISHEEFLKVQCIQFLSMLNDLIEETKSEKLFRSRAVNLVRGLQDNLRIAGIEVEDSEVALVKLENQTLIMLPQWLEAYIDAFDLLETKSGKSKKKK